MFTWDGVESFLLLHFGRVEAPEVLLPQLDALTLEGCGTLSAYVSKFQVLLARLGGGPLEIEDVHRFLKGLPYSIASQLRQKFAGTQAPLAMYINSLCALPDQAHHRPRHQKLKNPLDP